MEGCNERTRKALLAEPGRLELSFVELVVAVTECSEDASEIADLVDAMLDGDRVRLSHALRRDAPLESPPA